LPQFLHHNPFYWNFFYREIFNWNPLWLIVFNQISTYSIFLFLLYCILKGPDRINYFAPLCFVLFCKVLTIAQPWYFVLMPAFLTPISNRKHRLILYFLTMLTGTTAIIQIISGPFFPKKIMYYKGLSVFTKFVFPQ